MATTVCGHLACARSDLQRSRNGQPQNNEPMNNYLKLGIASGVSFWPAVFVGGAIGGPIGAVVGGATALSVSVFGIVKGNESS